MSKQIVYSNNARYALQKGINILAQTISVTLGPKGKNVVLGHASKIPRIVNDGITIAKEIQLIHSIENIGVALLRQAAAKTNEVAGDGTTTATVLAHAIVEEGLKNIRVGLNPLLLQKGIDKAVYFIVNKIAEYSRPVVSASDIISIASISAGNDTNIGEIIASALKQIGTDGLITLEEGHTIHTYLEITQGTKFNKGFISPYFVSDVTQSQIIKNNVLILLTDTKITSIKEELIPVLEKVANLECPLLIIAEDIEKEALATLIINKLRGIIDVIAVRAPGFGDQKKIFLSDLAVLTGAQVISKDFGLSLDSFTVSFLGSADRIIVSKDTTSLICSGNSKNIELRCSQIRKQIDASSNNYEKEKLYARLAYLSGRAAIIKVGAATQTEMIEKKLRLEDAISATKAAIEEGIVPGGGATLVHLSEQLHQWANKFLFSEELIGAQIVVKALSVPLATIVRNAGIKGNSIVHKIKKADFVMGYDANRNKIVDMYLAGIVDPAKVTRSALQNASSIASTILTTECIISDK